LVGGEGEAVVRVCAAEAPAEGMSRDLVELTVVGVVGVKADVSEIRTGEAGDGAEV
jgi:hypothetical protein